MAAQGLSNTAIAKRLSTTRTTVGLWRDRFIEGGPIALRKIKKGRGRKPSIPAEKIAQIVHDTLHTKPEDATHWSCRLMAKHHGVRMSTPFGPTVMA
ncbi:MAG: helix-turn-helix domain-containing protein [Egibacteraceae bacterium]